MTLDEFVVYIIDLLQRAAAVDGGVKVESFAEAGFTEKSLGFRLTFISGATAYVQVVGTYPPGTASSEGDPLSLVDVPGLPVADGRVSLRDIEAWNAAVVRNGGSRHVEAVAGYTTIEGRTSTTQTNGVRVTFYDQSRASLMFVYTLPPGEYPGMKRKEFMQLSAI